MKLLPQGVDSWVVVFWMVHLALLWSLSAVVYHIWDQQRLHFECQVACGTCSVGFPVKKKKRRWILLFATGRGVSTSVLVSHVDSVSLVQLSWYLGSMIASARLPPQPIGKIIHGRCSCSWHGQTHTHSHTHTHSAWLVSQQLQHPPPPPPTGSLLQFYSRFRLHHRSGLLLLLLLVVVVLVEDAALHRQQLSSMNTHRICVIQGERRGRGGAGLGW